MTQHIIEGWIRWTCPVDWQLTEEEGILTMFHPEGSGALNASFASRAPSEDPLPETARRLLDRFLASQERAADHIQTAVRADSAIASARVAVPGSGDEGPRLLLVWFIVTHNRGVMLTYNCLLPDGLKEMETVLEVIESVEFDG